MATSQDTQSVTRDFSRDNEVSFVSSIVINVRLVLNYEQCNFLIKFEATKSGITFFIQQLPLHSRCQIKKGHLLISYFVCPRFAYQILKVQKKNHFLTRGLRKHLDHHGSAHLDIKALKMPLKVKIAMVNPGLIKGQNWSKPYQNNIFHFFYSNPRLSEIFINFNQI